MEGFLGSEPLSLVIMVALADSANSGVYQFRQQSTVKESSGHFYISGPSVDFKKKNHEKKKRRRKTESQASRRTNDSKETAVRAAAGRQVEGIVQHDSCCLGLLSPPRVRFRLRRHDYDRLVRRSPRRLVRPCKPD